VDRRGEARTPRTLDDYLQMTEAERVRFFAAIHRERSLALVRMLAAPFRLARRLLALLRR